jgi:hypothetical protein
MTSNQIHDALIILFENGIEVLHSRAFCWLVFTTPSGFSSVRSEGYECLRNAVRREAS